MEKQPYKIPEGAIIIPQPYSYLCPHYFGTDEERGPTKVTIQIKLIRKVLGGNNLDTYIYWSCNRSKTCQSSCDLAYRK